MTDKELLFRVGTVSPSAIVMAEVLRVALIVIVARALRIM